MGLADGLLLVARHYSERGGKYETSENRSRLVSLVLRSYATYPISEPIGFLCDVDTTVGLSSLSLGLGKQPLVVANRSLVHDYRNHVYPGVIDGMSSAQSKKNIAGRDVYG